MLRSIPSGLLTVAALTLLGLGTACKASEQNYELVSEVRVPFTQTDLQDPAAARALLGRMHDAAVQACGGDPRMHSRFATMPDYTRAVFQKCRTAAVQRAVSQIGNATLTRVYGESRTRQASLAAASHSRDR